MNKAEKAIDELRGIDKLTSINSPMHRLSPLSKMALTIIYIITTVSFHKYDLWGIIPMVLFPIIGYQFSLIPVSTCFKKLRIVMPLVCCVGLLNPFFDKAVITHIGTVGVSGGVVSMVTLMLKGVFCLMASFLLVATTTAEEICAALNKIHCPKILTSLFLLTVRYISVLLEEVANMTDAYHLRAPGQKGIHISAWGSFLGQLILRSMDRAQALYESMLLRGFNGVIDYPERENKNKYSWVVAIICIVLIIFTRYFNIPAYLGSLAL